MENFLKLFNKIISEEFISFIKTYPGFMLFVLGAVCFFFAHNAINDYMIQVITPLGGTETQMGIAVSCAAFLELPTMALINKIMKKISVKNLLLISGIAFFIKHLLMLIAPNMAVVYISQAFQMKGLYSRRPSHSMSFCVFRRLFFRNFGFRFRPCNAILRTFARFVKKCHSDLSPFFVIYIKSTQIVLLIP